MVNPDGTFTYTPTDAAREAAAARPANRRLRTDTVTVTVTDGRNAWEDVRIRVAVAPAVS